MDAHKRGVDVQVILNKSQRSEWYNSAPILANEGITTYIDAAHIKVMIIDGKTLITARRALLEPYRKMVDREGLEPSTN